MSLSPRLKDAVLLLGAVHQRVGVGVQHVALDVVEMEGRQFPSANHAEQPASLRFVLHEELLAEPRVERIVQVALQGLGRRPEHVLLLLFGLDCFLALGAGGHAGRLELLFLQGHGPRGLCWIRKTGSDTELKCIVNISANWIHFYRGLFFFTSRGALLSTVCNIDCI